MAQAGMKNKHGGFKTILFYAVCPDRALRLVHNVLRQASGKKVSNTLSAVRSDGDKVGLDFICELNNARIFVRVIVHVERAISKAEFFGKRLQAIICNIVGSKVSGGIYVQDMQRGFEKSLQFLHVSDEVFLLFGLQRVGKYDISDWVSFIGFDYQDRNGGTSHNFFRV
jgi:hypothetical protein